MRGLDHVHASQAMKWLAVLQAEDARSQDHAPAVSNGAPVQAPVHAEQQEAEHYKQLLKQLESTAISVPLQASILTT